MLASDQAVVSHRLAIQGRDLLRQGQYAGALELINRALDANPKNAWAWARRSEIHDRIDDYSQAMEDINRSISLQPGYAWAIVWRSRLHQMLHHYEASLEDFDRAIAMDPSVFRADHVLPERGLILAMSGRFSDALPLFEQAVAADKANAFALYGRAAVRTLTRRDARAQQAIDEARVVIGRELDTETHTRAYYELGGLLALEEDYNGAFQILAEVVLLEKNQPILSPARKRAQLDLPWIQVRDSPRFKRLVGAS